LGKKHLPLTSLLFEAAPGTDKAQFEVRKYRNNSWQVAIDQTGNFDYKMGLGKKKSSASEIIDVMQ